MNTQPAFRPEALHTLTDEPELTAAEKKAAWQPDRARIDGLLKAQAVTMKLPKVFYSQRDPELRELLPCEATFHDELIERYEVTASKEGTVQIRIVPKDLNPFWITIDGNGVKGPPELLSTFLTVQTQQTSTIQQYAQGSLRGVMGGSEAVVPLAGVPFHVTQGSDAGIAA
ncbi:MAG: hypothetical protein PHZ00_05640 [Candidatus Peribacteraceae bacterium]|nr:hypothetical protein [Candidatus Peribacteraceae bacterium]